MLSHVFPLAASFSNTVNTLKKIGITEKEEGLPVLDTGHSKHFCFLLTAELHPPQRA